MNIWTKKRMNPIILQNAQMTKAERSARTVHELLYSSQWVTTTQNMVIAMNVRKLPIGVVLKFLHAHITLLLPKKFGNSVLYIRSPSTSSIWLLTDAVLLLNAICLAEWSTHTQVLPNKTQQILHFRSNYAALILQVHQTKIVCVYNLKTHKLLALPERSIKLPGYVHTVNCWSNRFNNVLLSPANFPQKYFPIPKNLTADIFYKSIAKIIFIYILQIFQLTRPQVLSSPNVFDGKYGSNLSNSRYSKPNPSLWNVLYVYIFDITITGPKHGKLCM